jgi:glycosyltransferase involved in cell wall biosynthesis
MNTGSSSQVPASWSQTASPVVVDPAEAARRRREATQEGTTRHTLRVLHVVNGEHFSGAERVQSHLGRCLPEFGVQADFACVKPGLFAKAVSRQQGRWGKAFETPMSRRWDLSVAWKIYKLVLRHEYQLLHAHTPRTAMVAATVSRMAGVPWVYHVHSPAARDSAKRFSNWVNAVVEKTSLSGCSHLITVSESLRLDCMRRGFNEDRVTVIHNGVPAICPPRESTPQVGSLWTLGMVALMRPRKGLEIVLQALAQLRQRHDIALRIIGPFETAAYENTIERRIEQLGIADRIQRVGFTDEVPAELAKLDALVLPSLFGEGLPMVVLEAMAAGLPVIATRVEGTPEAITDGVEGLLAEPGNADSLAAKIEQLVSGQHDWQQLADNAKQRHQKDFSDVAMAKRTAEIYRGLV